MRSSSAAMQWILQDTGLNTSDMRRALWREGQTDVGGTWRVPCCLIFSAIYSAVPALSLLATDIVTAAVNSDIPPTVLHCIPVSLLSALSPKDT